MLGHAKKGNSVSFSGSMDSIAQAGRELLQTVTTITLQNFDENDPIFTRDSVFPRKDYVESGLCLLCMKKLGSQKRHWYPSSEETVANSADARAAANARGRSGRCLRGHRRNVSAPASSVAASSTSTVFAPSSCVNTRPKRSLLDSSMIRWTSRRGKRRR